MAGYFKDYIRESQLLTEDQYRKVLTDSMSARSGTFYGSLLKSGFLSEDQVIDEACKFFGYERLASAFHTQIDFEISFKIHSIEQIIRRRQFAVRVNDEVVFVLADPEQEGPKSSITTALGYTPKFTLITAAEFDIFSKHQIKPKQNELASNEVASDKTDVSNIRISAGEMETSAAQKLLNALIECAIELRASDLHIRAMGDNNAIVQLRIDGKLRKYTEVKANALVNLRNLLMTKCKLGGNKPNAPVEGQMNVAYNGEMIDTRVNVVKAQGGYDFVLRFITSKSRSLESLGLSPINQRRFRRMLSFTKGLVLVVGPTGSGKTTLLYAGLEEKLKEWKVIYTMEDPVEITLPGAVQVSIDRDRAQGYERASTSSLRHDPDIIVYGEIRERTVADAALRASDTGHLVLATVHAHDAPAAISRLVNIGVDPYVLGDSLAGVVAQRLVRRVCPNCKEEYELSPNSRYRKIYKLGDGKITLARGTGCAKCGGSGYFDRIAINELIIVNASIRDAIQMKAPRSEIEKALLKSGFRSYIDDGKDKALAGITTFEELDDLKNDVLTSFRSDEDVFDDDFIEEEGES